MCYYSYDAGVSGGWTKVVNRISECFHTIAMLCGFPWEICDFPSLKLEKHHPAPESHPLFAFLIRILSQLYIILFSSLNFRRTKLFFSRPPVASTSTTARSLSSNYFLFSFNAIFLREFFFCLQFYSFFSAVEGS